MAVANLGGQRVVHGRRIDMVEQRMDHFAQSLGLKRPELAVNRHAARVDGRERRIGCVLVVSLIECRHGGRFVARLFEQSKTSHVVHRW